MIGGIIGLYRDDLSVDDGVAYAGIGGLHQDLPLADGALETAVGQSGAQPNAIVNPAVKGGGKFGIEKFFRHIYVVLPIPLERRDAAAVATGAVDELRAGILGLECAKIELQVPTVAGVGAQVGGGQIVRQNITFPIYGVGGGFLLLKVELLRYGDACRETEVAAVGGRSSFSDQAGRPEAAFAKQGVSQAKEGVVYAGRQAGEADRKGLAPGGGDGGVGRSDSKVGRGTVRVGLGTW